MSSQKETEPHVQEESSPQCPDTPNVPYSHPNDDRRDEALDFLEKYKNAAALGLSRDAAFTRGLRKKIDFRVLPFLWLCYTLCFIDKVLLNYAKIMGMSTQLNLVGDDYSNASAAFFISSLIFSLPNVWLLNRLPVGKCLAVNLIGWGVCNACHAALENYAGLVTLRVLSGAFEAGVIPALILIVSQYFDYKEQAPRFALWYMGMGTGQILGGLISFAFQQMSPDAELSSWKTMFLVLGLVNLVLGILVMFFVPDSPMQARFLTNNEKVVLLEHIRINQTGIENPHFHSSQLLEGVLDIGCWLLYLITVLHLVGSGAVTAYSATILTSFGYTPKVSALLNTPSGAINIVATLAYAFYVRHHGRRYLVIFTASMIGTLGAALLCFLPHSTNTTTTNNNKAGLLAALYLINAVPGAGTIYFQWLSCNVAGHTKRAYATAMMNAAFSIGNIIGPETFRAQDAPEFRPAKLTLVVCWALAGAVSLVTGWYYAMRNRAREKKKNEGEGHVEHEGEEEEVKDTQAYAGLTDKQNKAFRYHL